MEFMKGSMTVTEHGMRPLRSSFGPPFSSEWSVLGGSWSSCEGLTRPKRSRSFFSFNSNNHGQDSVFIDFVFQAVSACPEGTKMDLSERLMPSHNGSNDGNRNRSA